MILSNKRITKVLISLRRCADWSASMLFSNLEDRFSRVEAQLFFCGVSAFLYAVGLRSPENVLTICNSVISRTSGDLLSVDNLCKQFGPRSGLTPCQA